LLYQLLLVQDCWSCASNILFLSARSPILSYNYRLENQLVEFHKNDEHENHVEVGVENDTIEFMR